MADARVISGDSIARLQKWRAVNVMRGTSGATMWTASSMHRKFTGARPCLNCRGITYAVERTVRSMQRQSNATRPRTLKPLVHKRKAKQRARVNPKL